MKVMKSAPSIAVLLLLPFFSLAQSPLIKKLYADTLTVDPVLKEKMIFKIQTHEADTNALNLLHYTRVVAYRINEPYHAKTSKEHETNSIADRAHNKLSSFISPEGKDLTEEQIKTLLNLCKTPENFVWSSCLGKVPEAGFVFLNNGKIIGYINVSCHFKQCDTAPFVLQTKWGTLTNEGSAKLIELCKELGVFYEVKQ